MIKYKVRNEELDMIKIYQISSKTLDKIYPQSPFMYGMGDNKFFDLKKNLDNYEHVADIDAKDLDEAFEIGNIGPDNKIMKWKNMHSLSVGDILEVSPGEKFIVARFGFDKVEAA
jgi:hypothetical protein